MRETPLIPYKKLISSNRKTKYAAKIGSIMYAIVRSPIDIVSAMSMVSCFVKNPRPDYFSAVNKIFQYLAGS